MLVQVSASTESTQRRRGVQGGDVTCCLLTSFLRVIFCIFMHKDWGGGTRSWRPKLLEHNTEVNVKYNLVHLCSPHLNYKKQIVYESVCTNSRRINIWSHFAWILCACRFPMNWHEVERVKTSRSFFVEGKFFQQELISKKYFTEVRWPPGS